MPLWDLTAESPIFGESHFDQSAMTEVHLILRIQENLVGAPVGGGLNWVERAQTRSSRRPHVCEIAGRENVRGGKINAAGHQVVHTPARILVLTFGKPVDYLMKVLCIETLGEPRPPFDQRSGKIGAWCPILQKNALVISDSGDEIRRGVAELVVTSWSLDGNGP